MPAELLADLQLLLQPSDHANCAGLVEFRQPQQLHQLEHLVESANAGVADQVSRLSLREEGFERDDGDEIDEEPSFQVAHHYRGPVLRNDAIIVIYSRVEDDDDVDEEQAIDDVVRDDPPVAQLLEERQLQCGHKARVEQQGCDEEVPIQLHFVGGQYETGVQILFFDFPLPLANHVTDPNRRRLVPLHRCLELGALHLILHRVHVLQNNLTIASGPDTFSKRHHFFLRFCQLIVVFDVLFGDWNRLVFSLFLYNVDVVRCNTDLHLWNLRQAERYT